MSNVIKPKRGSTVPTSSNLENGEIGINTSNQSLYYGTGDGVQQIKSENVTGVVGIEHGGTGSPTRNGALRALINGGGNFTGDLNTLTDTGVYWINLSDCTNGPASSGYGTMEIISYEVVLQRFTSYQDGNVYCRTYTNSQWYEWQEIFGTKSTVPISSGGTGSTNRGEAYKTLITGGLVSSDGEYDLNHYKIPGVYWISLSNHSNGPGTKGFGHLEVISGSTSLLIQRFTYYTGNMYYRTFANSQWYDWKQIPTAVVGIENGGTGANNAADAQMNLGIMHVHDIVASDQNDWRNKVLSQILQNSINYGGGFQCGSIGWSGIQFGQYFATSIGSGLPDRILALIYNSAGTNYALEVWRCDGGVWNACAVKGASLQTMPGLGYGTADQRPSAGLPGRIYFQKV